jgi:intracellular multiplication protein IcmC
MSTCTGGNVACWIANQVDILNNLANSLAPVERLLTGAAYLMGIMFFIKSIHTLKTYGESRSSMSQNSTLKEPLVYMLVGAALLYFPTTFKIFMVTSFGYENVLQYAPINSTNSTINTLFGSGSAVGRPLSLLIQVIGLVAFIRGWVLVARASSQGQQPGGTGKGIVHVFGGILAMNIVGTLQIVNNTLYGP